MESIQTKVATGLLAVALGSAAAFVSLKVLPRLVTGAAASWGDNLATSVVAGLLMPVMYCVLRRLSLNLLMLLAASCTGVVFACFYGPLWAVPHASLCMLVHKSLANRLR